MKLKEILSLILLPFLLLFVAAMSSGAVGTNLLFIFLVSLPLEVIYVLNKLKKIKIDGNLRVKNVISMIMLPIVLAFVGLYFGDAKNYKIANPLFFLAIETFIFDFLYALIFVLKSTWD